MNDSPDAEIVRCVFDCDPVRGVLIRKSGRFAGLETKTHAADKHRRVRFNGGFEAIHRLIWLHITGHWPSGVIDHINGDKTDNRFANLRDVDASTNMQNQRRATKASKTGLLGAHPHRDFFVAQITVDGKIKHLGSFKTAEDAHAAYLNAKRELHAGCTI